MESRMNHIKMIQNPLMRMTLKWRSNDIKMILMRMTYKIR